MPIPLEIPVIRRRGVAAARVFCYLLGPLSALLILRLRTYAEVWSVRFHAFHSVLMTTLWALTWSALRGFEKAFPWFLSTLLHELRVAVNLSFILIWIFLLATAYGGSRCATVPVVHRLAVRLARKSQLPLHA